MNARLARSQARGLWALGGDFLGRLAIGRIMIFRPQPVSVDPGWVRGTGIESGRSGAGGRAASDRRITR
jgi:hypothetical protein